MFLKGKDKVTLFYLFSCSFAFIVIASRAFCVPFSHDEAATFFFYVQTGEYLPYSSHLYTNNHFLNSALANVMYELAGSHRFILRFPNVLSFIVFAVGVFKFFKHIHSTSGKLLLTALLLLNIHFLDFFELCRGYGLSMALMTLGLAHFTDYCFKKHFKSLGWFFLCFQLALAANLTLAPIFFILLVLLLYIQLKEGSFLHAKNLSLFLLNLAFLCFWITLIFYYRNKGLLDSGSPGNYWETTFVSLIYMVFGSGATWIQVAIVILFSIIVIYAGRSLIRKKVNLFSPDVIFTIITILLIVTFFIQNALAGVNYPEDRTVLFLYVLFSISLAFTIDRLSVSLQILLASASLAFALISFILFFNFNSFNHYFYRVIPKEFYAFLEKEFQSQQKLFTIGGHPLREMSFAFSNYRGNSVLNPMDAPEQMHMNCDYYIAAKHETVYYKHFYDEVLSDETSQRVLLKRKQPIRRTRVFTRIPMPYYGNDEFIEFIRISDSAVTTRNSIDVDVELQFNRVPAPFNGWLVAEAHGQDNRVLFYKRIPFNWLADDLNGKRKRLRLTCPPLPEHFKDFTVYIWNVEKQNINVSLNDLTLFKLDGDGINFVIPDSYYKRIVPLTAKVVLP